MTYQFHPSDTSSLRDKVVVLTGGALGVGASLVRILHSAGAHVFFGDILDEPGRALEEELAGNNYNTHVKYVHCDVTSYAQNLALFDEALKTCGRIDHAVANAGLGEQPGMFDPKATLESIRQEPRAMKGVDVNLKGPMYFANIAAVYLRQGGSGTDKSLTLVSSVAGFREDPGLQVYVAAKHGVLGLMRSIRELLVKPPFSIRTNAICPWMTKTRLTTALEPIWEQAGLPANTAEDVARVIASVMVDSSLNGGTMYIEGGRAWNVEAGILATRPQWLGEKQTSDLDIGTALMGGGEHWTAGKNS